MVNGRVKFLAVYFQTIGHFFRHGINIEFYRSCGNEIKIVKVNGKDFIEGVGIPIGNYFSGQVLIESITSSISSSSSGSLYFRLNFCFSVSWSMEVIDSISTCPATDENIEFYRSCGNEIKIVKVNGKLQVTDAVLLWFLQKYKYHPYNGNSALPA